MKPNARSSFAVVFTVAVLLTTTNILAQGHFSMTFTEPNAVYGSATVTTDTIHIDHHGVIDMIEAKFGPAYLPELCNNSTKNFGGITIFSKTEITGPGNYGCDILFHFCPQSDGTFNNLYDSRDHTENTMVLSITEFDSVSGKGKGTIKGSYLVNEDYASGKKNYFTIDASFECAPGLVRTVFMDGSNPLADTIYARGGEPLSINYRLSLVDSTLPMYYYCSNGGFIELRNNDTNLTKINPNFYTNCKLDSTFRTCDGNIQFAIDEKIPPGVYKFKIYAKTWCGALGPADSVYVVVVSRYELTLKHHGIPWLTLMANADREPNDSTAKGWRRIGFAKFETTEGLTTLNSFLKFKGTMIVDTQFATLTYTGKWYCETLLPFFGTKGEYILDSSGGRTASISGRIVFTPLSLAIDKYISSKLGGFKFRTDSLVFLSGADPKQATGIRLGCTLLVPTLPDQSCDSSKVKNREIVLNPIEITDQGIGGAVTLKNIRLYPGFCVNSVFASYYSKPDSLSIGAELKAPFFEKIGIAAGWLEGTFNAFSLDVKLDKSIPIANTTLGLKGARGSASNWYIKPPLKFSFGGTVNQVASPEILEWDLDLSYKEPSELNGKATARFFKTGSVWQLESSAALTLDWRKFVSIEGTYKAGNLGTSGDYVLDGNGKLTFTWNPSVSVDGSLVGILKIPKIGVSDNIFTDFINLALPISIGRAEAILKDKRIRANIQIHNTTAHFVCDLTRSITDPDFLSFGYGAIPLGTHDANKSKPLALGERSVTIGSNTKLLLLRVRTKGTLPSSYLLSPTGEKITATINDSSIVYATSTDRSFWYIESPQSGVWTLHIDNPAASDSIDAEMYMAERSFAINASQVSKTATITWDTAGAAPSSTVDLYLDTDTSGNDGIRIGQVNESDGSFSYELSDSLAACEYYVYGLRDDRGGLTSAYAQTLLSVDKSSLPQPTNVRAGLDSATSTIIVKWQKPVVLDNIERYIVSVISEDGSDSVYMSVSPVSSQVGLKIPDITGKKIRVVSMAENGMHGCWTYPVAITPSSIDQKNSNGETIHITLYPNPAHHSTQATLTLPRSARVIADLYDVLGRKCATVANMWAEAGEQKLELDLARIPAGTYYIRIQADDIVTTRSLEIVR